VSRLFTSEFLRARSRRMVPVLIVGIIVGTVIGMTIGAAHSHKPTAERLAATQALYERQRAQCLRGKFLGTANPPPPYTSVEEYCDDTVRPENFAGSGELQLNSLPDLLLGISSIVALLGVLLGSTLGGADWGAGTMGTLLTWEPRRFRVLLTRAAVIALIVFAITIFLQAFVSVMFWAAAALRGSTHASSGMWRDTIEQLLRNGALSSGFAVVALSVATLTRSTAAAVGALFGYLVIFEGFLASLWMDLQPRLLVHAATVVASQTPLIDPRATATYGPDGNLINVTRPGILLSVRGAWFVVGIWVVVLLGVALFAFRQRDVS
jgi:ABC-2 type transport system permease protein